MLDFHVLEKGLVIVSPTHFVHDFSRKLFLMLYSSNWPNFIVLLPLNFEIDLIFLIKPFLYMTEKSR